MSNSLDSFLTRIGDVTIERVTPRGTARIPEQNLIPPETSMSVNLTPIGPPRRLHDESSDDSSGELSDGDIEKKNRQLHLDEMDDMHAECSADDMDLDETIDSQIGVRMDSERQHRGSSPLDDDEIDDDDDDVDGVNILDTLPLEGAPIEGQEVTEADLLGKSISKEMDDEDEIEKSETQSGDEDGHKRHADSDGSESAMKKQKIDDDDVDDDDDSASECETKMEKKLANMRRNIREVMDETQLDEATLSAQRQEMERLRRVQEQQKIIREVRLPSTVLLKVNSGSGAGSQCSSQTQSGQMKRPMDGMKWQKGRGALPGVQTSISRVPSKQSSGPSMLQQRIRMMTPSVSISPVVPKKEPTDRSEYYSDSDFSDTEADELLREKQLHTMKKMTTVQKVSKPAKGKDVVTISSSSESSDDDCIVLSDPSGGEETDNEDDPANSGMHTNDRYNVPDEHGRVLINVGHPEMEPDVFLAPQVARIIKPHQIGGIRFLFDNIVESIDRYKTSSGFGCILAHSMGLGKTLQVASFCDIFFRCTTARTVLCIMPINTLQNWLAEFNMWLPYEDPDAPKVEPETSVKTEPGTDVKPEVKEEGDLSGATEATNQLSQENANILHDTFQNQYNAHNGFGPGFGPDGIINKGVEQTSLNPNFHTNMNPSTYGANSVPNFPSINQPNIGANSFGINNPGNIYPNQMQTQVYQGMENRPGQVYPGMEPPSVNPMNPPPNPINPINSTLNSSMNPPVNLEMNSMYNYGNPAQSYSFDSSKQEAKNESDLQIKKELSEPIKKDEGAEPADAKTEKVKTPFNVDAPAGLEIRPRHFRLHILNDSHKTMTARSKVIKDWQKNGGVLLIGYELYRQLSLKKANKAKRKRGQPVKDPDIEEDDKNKGLLDEMHTALVNPGPDLVICDEGHRIKNSHASISLALKQMRTKRRIVLTGYPLQNNLLEYWCMVDFVRPNYLGTKAEFCNMFERPIQNGQCIDSTPQDIRLMRYRAHVLHALLEGFVQRRSHSVLQISLPRKEEYILLVRMTPHQRKLYDTFMNQVVKTRAVPNPLKAFAVCCKIWNHPDVLYHFLRKRQANEEDDLDLEETIGEKTPPGGVKRSKARQPKGEGKKGKKTLKNKPAASVQPNLSSTTNNETVEGGDVSNNSTKSTLTNFPAQKTSSPPFTNVNSSNSYPYQNYQQNDQNNYYRNDNSQNEFTDFYNNQDQQRFGNQNFQQYPQGTPGYNNNSNQTYPNQQNYIQGNDQSTNRTQRFPAPANPEFRSEQNQGNNFEPSGIYPRQNYPYQDQGRNYPTINQDQNYPQVQNQNSTFPPHLPNQTPMSDYSSFPTANPNQNYPSGSQPNTNYPRNENQSTTLNYGGNQPSAPTNTSGNPPFGQNQQNQSRPYQQNQNLGSHYTQNMVPNSPSMSPALGFTATQQTGNFVPPSTSQIHYGQNTNQEINQNQRMGNQGIQNPSIASNSNQGHQGIQNPAIASNSNQGMGQNSYSNNQGNGQQNHGYQNPIQQQRPTSTNVGYPTQSGPVSGQMQGHRYPLNQGSNIYPASQQTSQNSQMYGSGTDRQNQNFVSTSGSCQTSTSSANPDYQAQNQSRPSSSTVLGNYSDNNPNQGSQFKNSNDPFWQQNYSQTMRQEQCNDSNYFREPNNVNRFQNNYLPQQNYQNQSFEYSGGRVGDGNQRGDDSKSTHGNSGIHGQGGKDTMNSIGVQSQPLLPSNNASGRGAFSAPMNPVDALKDDEKEKEETIEKEKEEKSDDENLTKDEEKDVKCSPSGKEDPGIPYDWATELMRGYIPGLIDASAKMTLFFCILEEAIRLEDRVLAFSQSLFTLNLIEDFLARNNFKYPDGTTDAWLKNVNYYRLDGSTSALEREKLINEFNVNPKIHLFLVSTRAGSLGINLVGANRAIVFDASWNPCHDTQAVCRVYRYGQQKPCFVYRLVTDNCLERKIYDRQISKQGMADRVVDQCNPDAHLSLKEATTLSWDWEEDSQVQDFSQSKDSYSDEVMHTVLEKHSSLLTKQPFHHESLLVDRKDKKLSQAEKRLARRGYELEKMAATCSRPSYNYIPGNTATRAGGLQIRAIRGVGGGGGGVGGGSGGGMAPGALSPAAGDMGPTPKPVASVRPMQQRGVEGVGPRSVTGSRWIPAEVWQRQGMSAQEMTLPLDVVIPTNSPDKGSIVLKAGQRVMVLKSPKGIYMQLESGKIIAIRTALKLNQQKREDEPKKGLASMMQRNSKAEVGFPLRNNSAISIIPKSSSSAQGTRPPPKSNPGPGYRPFADKETAKRSKPIATATAKPYTSQVNLTNQVSLSRLPRVKQEPLDQASLGDNSNSSDGSLRSDQRVEEVRLEDVVAEVSSNEYSRPSRPLHSNQKSSQVKSQSYSTENVSRVQSIQQPEVPPKIDKPLAESTEIPDSSAGNQYQSPFPKQQQQQQQQINSASDEVSQAPAAAIQPAQSGSVVSQSIPNTSKNLRDTCNSPLVSTPVSSSVSTAVEQNVLDLPQPDIHGVSQGYPYAQYPRYYDYADPRARSLGGTPYGSYFPGPPPQSNNPRHNTEGTKAPAQPDLPKAGNNSDEITVTNKAANTFVPPPSLNPPPSVDTKEAKPTDAVTSVTATSTTANRDENLPSTAFTHPTAARYPGPYPPAPYDPYAQHYPPAPGSSAAYPPGTPGYPAYGGPADYARMYSPFHGPPAADPYMHRSYAPPPSAHPPGYYPPFPHPPPPYPNYSFLPPYPNPSEPQPPPPPSQ
ncbi:uncharacterized protein LOC122498019 isoform X2 [Leptopilina heterotoma]|uniref:uncharacterized protein LOC122498019 isoform X2 n=1 Tax=Leptopilina heterotoma TaxID=63436 RepID=UPI001CA9A59B|nr:uncharacterized protein LOC122498019 isoform X2 [Leptopilina heterotoma]